MALYLSIMYYYIHGSYLQCSNADTFREKQTWNWIGRIFLLISMALLAERPRQAARPSKLSTMNIKHKSSWVKAEGPAIDMAYDGYRWASAGMCAWVCAAVTMNILLARAGEFFECRETQAHFAVVKWVLNICGLEFGKHWQYVFLYYRIWYDVSVNSFC